MSPLRKTLLSRKSPKKSPQLVNKYNSVTNKQITCRIIIILHNLLICKCNRIVFINQLWRDFFGETLPRAVDSGGVGGVLPPPLFFPVLYLQATKLHKLRYPVGRALFRVSSGIIGAPTESGRGHQAVTRDTNFSEIGHREHGACGH